MSVLCPGFVRTGLLRHETGPEPVTRFGNLMLELIRAGIEGGIEPSEVADQVIDAVRTERFWILTHADMREMPVARMQRAAAQENPRLDSL